MWAAVFDNETAAWVAEKLKGQLDQQLEGVTV
jgi:hypothetical protein